MQAAVTLKSCNQAPGELDVLALAEALTEQTSAVIGGDLSRAEAMLAAQAHTLDAIYNTLTCRAISAQDMGRLETLLKLALRAQSQSRATWETLSTIKNPPSISYVAQANVAHGHQQVNNAPTRGGEIENTPNELLEQGDGERLDIGATSTSSGADPALEALAAVHRSEDS